MLDRRYVVDERAAQRGSGSRVDKMLSDNSRIGTLEKLVMQPTSGLEFLVKAGRLDLAAETIAVDQRFVPIVPLHVMSSTSPIQAPCVAPKFILAANLEHRRSPSSEYS